MKLNQIPESIITKIPSLQDLASAIKMFQIGKPSVIYPEEGGYLIIQPAKGRKPNINATKYNDLVKQSIIDGNLDKLIDGLREMGFEISGDINGKIGKSNPNLEAEVRKFGSQIPKSTGKEVGGVKSPRGEGGAEATELRRIGTPDHVEIEVEYGEDDIIDPSEALDDIDDTFVYHTHPKMADNNYFPGKMQIR